MRSNSVSTFRAREGNPPLRTTKVTEPFNRAAFFNENITDSLVSDAFQTSFMKFNEFTKKGQHSKRKLDHDVLSAFKTHESRISPFVLPLAKDLFVSSKPNRPVPKSISDLWSEKYKEIHDNLSFQMFDRFIELVPYFLTFVVHLCIFNVSNSVSFTCPLRTEIAQRIFYIFTGYSYIDGFLENRISDIFGYEVIDDEIVALRKAATKKQMLYAPEDVFQLHPFEPRVQLRRDRFNLKTRSPITQQKPSLNVTIPVEYLPLSEEKFKATMPAFTGKADVNSKSFIMRSIKPQVYNLATENKAELDAKMHEIDDELSKDRKIFKLKKDAVLEANREDKNIFLKQLRENQKRNIYFEDPDITMDMLRRYRKKIAQKQASLIPDFHLDTTSSQARSVLGEEIVEVQLTHLSDAERQAMIGLKLQPNH